MRIIRLIFFIPIAFTASVLVGSLIKSVAESRFPQLISWSVSGAFSAITLLIVGFIVAPQVSKIIKWLLISVTAIFGLMSTIGSLMGEDKSSAAAGVSMIFISSMFINKSTEELSRIKYSS